MTLQEKQNLFLSTITDLMPGIDDSESPAGEILKIHLLTEVLLDHLIIGVFEADHGRAILDLELRYSQKLTLCSKATLSCGRSLLTSDVIGSLKKLNSLRNAFAHNLRKTLTEDDVESLFVGALGSDRSGPAKDGPLFNRLISYKTRIHCQMLEYDPNQKS